MKSEFAEWFKAQHGSRESVFRSETDQELRDLISQGRAAANELDRRLEWDARRQSALYAWSVDRSADNGRAST